MVKLLAFGAIATAWIASCAAAQEKNPPVRVNILNVCTPSQSDQKELSAALNRIPLRPHWAGDFEVSRGRTTLPADAKPSGVASSNQTAPAISTWARMRREFAPDAPFSNAQYSFSRDASSMVETLVLNFRNPKDLLQISIEDTVSAVSAPATVLATDTPANRVKLERFGKSSIVLARCSPESSGAASVDQSAYEPLFRTASGVLAAYRTALGARQTIPGELVRVSLKPGYTRSMDKRKHNPE